MYACWHCPIVTNLNQVTLSCSTSQRSKSWGNAITQPQSYPIPKFYILNGMGLRLGNGISNCFFVLWEVEYDRPFINLSLFFRENILLFCKNWNHVGEFPNKYECKMKCHNPLMLCSCSQELKSLRDRSLSDPNPCGNHWFIGTLYYYYFCCSSFWILNNFSTCKFHYFRGRNKDWMLSSHKS